ncbi:ABC transporter permease subunit [Mediterraneibacter glycyrrhizinilyticus]|nr:ABC transporter permease subunit [Mediterraneibacter glycyrrhizinilyticus]MBM6855280.1 ABC transporter permease subunit [Mediterraneibacter glycyrrhizinilyticus]
MINYIRSESYRILHTKDIYLFTGLMALGILFLNVGLYVSAGAISGFQYANVKFSLSFLTDNMLFLAVAGAILSVLLFSGERRIGVMKNAVAYGISRKSLFLGKCIVSFAAAFASMILLTAVYVISAVLLLDGPVQPYLGLMLQGIAVNLLFAAAGVILAAGFTQFFEKELVSGLAWMGVVFLLPAVFYMAGFEIPLLAKIASWMPRNYLMTDVMAGMSGYLCLWSEPAGAVKCILAGVAGIIVFAAAGVFMNRRKEI